MVKDNKPATITQDDAPKSETKPKFETTVTDAPTIAPDEGRPDQIRYPSEAAPPLAAPSPPSKRLQAEQEAGRAALHRKHSPAAKAAEKDKGGKK